MNTLSPKLSDFQQARVLVVGDVMLDRYWFGDVNRISPEAPVPVAKINKTDHRAGGAANVARNIAALGGQVALLSVVGDDEAADTLANLLQQDGIANYLHRSAHAPTTLKLRVLARNQQLIRLDFEEQPDQSSLHLVAQHYADLVAQYDAVILSDYGKGVLNEVAQMIATARALGKPVLIDPKGSDYQKYRGATLLTPNRAELKEAAGGGWASEAELTAKAQTLREQLGLDALLVTRSEEGMSLYRANQTDHQPTRAQEVYDVSGAGDTVIAAMGLCLAAGYALPDAMHVANAAAGVVVAKLGTAVCSFDELQTALKG
ncbi:D-glycero-beta-D-manno-heptose-7-phosphate kinase [Kingella kingae]|uniref:D-glycero-beta-D-manno-heptose-7-phosphate kinase n=1 Tax=Kingella kingae TaxID=504 RepID=UPI000258658A|nr:D-glycero-beta-D-manno-heptose-7-phosphate kinase [Kingella kingae]EIC12886.1 DP-heptose synthetase [Kingella kingae PYKK081]MBD3614629.1 D-glycero-beta-D-manno-heptose-7-phosphate kinase [Kingella kingae]MBD3632943.1 D-glycero-beta-D-manno-heptose-7-phosphate kinase [Kingella kingae]MBD3660252.1 D-glycero-beta-D-manno-heptose-7-phosphate kinase [Kingella kingae]MDK4569359.1 D-glycero-beta-D-manno-heptose-7-phosphate kinase [Kingella kingae]